MTIEKWESRPVPANRPATRSMPRAVATRTQEIMIDSNSTTVTGAPLTLEFREIFLRNLQLTSGRVAVRKWYGIVLQNCPARWSASS